MDVPETESQIVRYLREIGVDEIYRGVGGQGVCVVIVGQYPGRCLGIRADCDGLPIKEETELPFASTNGNMHACGHDAHTAIALGAGRILANNRSLLRGKVKLIFQPYEEGDGGAKAMINAGVLESPHVDALIALHTYPDVEKRYKPGDVLVTRDPTSANIFAYKAVFCGTGGHVCLSRTRVNPVYIACDAVTRIAEAAKTSDNIVNAVTVIGGGVRSNIIPESCCMEGSIRSFDRKAHLAAIETVKEIIHSCAEKWGGSAEITVNIDLMGTEINPQLFAEFRRVTDTMFPNQPAVLMEQRDMIGEDFARYAALVPAMYFFLCTSVDGMRYPLHNPKFMLDERKLYKGSALLAAFALDLPDSPSFK